MADLPSVGYQGPYVLPHRSHLWTRRSALQVLASATFVPHGSEWGSQAWWLSGVTPPQAFGSGALSLQVKHCLG